MKKSVRLLSVVMLIAMVFSMMTSGAYAIVSDGAGGNVGSISPVVIGAPERPTDDSPFDGDNEPDAPATGRDVSEEAEKAKEEEKKYEGMAESYAGIIDSAYALVLENVDFLKYVRDNKDVIDTATLQTAVDLFGEEAVYGYPEPVVTEEIPAEGEEGEAAEEGEEAPPAISFEVPATKITSKWAEVCSAGTSLASVLNGGTLVFDKGKSFDICNSTDYRITVDLHGTTIDATACEAAFTIKSKSVTFTNGTINGDGFYITGNGVLNLGGLINTNWVDITVNATQANAVYVENGLLVIGEGTTLNGPKASASTPKGTVYCAPAGSVRMTGGIVRTYDSYGMNIQGSELEISSAVAEVVAEEGALCAIKAATNAAGATLKIHAGVITGPTGIVIEGQDSRLDMNGGRVTGKLKNISNNYEKSGAAVEVHGDPKASGTSPIVYINVGTLRSEYNAALVSLTADGTRYAGAKNDIKRITVDTKNVGIQEAHGQESDYAKANFLINGTGYMTLEDVIAEMNTATEKLNIKMLGNYIMGTADYVAINATAPVVFDGGGYEIRSDANNPVFQIAGGDVTFTNVHLNGNHLNSAFEVDGGKAYLGSEIYVKHFENGVYVKGGTVTVNGFDVDDDTDTGISCEGGETTVIMCKIDCDRPVWAKDGNKDLLHLKGGWFAHKASVNPGETEKAEFTVSTYVDPDVSYVKYVNADKYYEVLFNTTPTVEIKMGSTGFESNGTPYVIYDKSDPDPIIFTITPAVETITAISRTPAKTSYNLFTAEAGKSGDIRIPDNDVLMDCPAGAYDLQFTFKNGYVIKDRLSLYVFPKVAKLFWVPNTYNIAECEVGNNPAELAKYLTSDYAIGTYDVYSQHNIAVVMSELPDKICIGNDPDGSDEILLENFDANIGNTYHNVLSGKYAGNYVYFISYADLNNLAAGQNYVFLEWDGIKGALKRLAMTVTNGAVKISPTSLDWSGIKTTANFEVMPDVQTVYIDGDKVDPAYYTYNTDNHVLSIKANYLRALDNKEHTMEIITSQGKVSATLNTGVGLGTKDVDYHVYGGAKPLSFVASDKINQEAGIWIGSTNPTKLDPSCYTWDSTNGFTLSSAFLNRLSLGTYYISCYVYNGSEYEYTTTTFRVVSASQAAYTPATGDNSNIIMWLVILVLSAVAIVVILLPRLKKKSKATGKDTSGEA